MSFLYLTLPDFEVLRNTPEGEFESFTASDPSIDEGWVVFATYRTYDSFEEHPDNYYQVLDVYTSREKAIGIATNIQNKFLKHKPEPLIAEMDNGTPIKYMAFEGWGNTLIELTVKRLAIRDFADIERFY